ncbi:trans-1,2-dihydrobenzene-1,2-diol dehydrogenase-like [Haemaphysalis longicornis]
MAQTRWGIVAAGRISNDFVAALSTLPREEHEVVAVAGRNFENAKKFAKLHGISKVYPTYEELARDPEVEVAYVGSLHPDHYPTMKLLLENGKHVLCEKPLTMNRQDTEDICRIAKDKKLFLMEGLWSRHLPTYKHMADALNNDVIGEPRYVHSSHGYPMQGLERVFRKDLGGSVVLTLANYCANLALQVFGAELPLKISAVGELAPEGVDQHVAAVMEFSRGRLATFAVSGLVRLPSRAEIVGTRGTITLHPPYFASTCIETPAGKIDTPFPTVSVPLNFPNTTGLRYQAEEVRRCLREGLLESPVMTHRDSALIAEILDEVLKQVGVEH